jgi:aminoglycoside 6'-N-acetyltransferase I
MIQKATLHQAKDAAELALLLWPENELEILIEEMTDLITQPDAVVMLDYKNKEAIGFAQCQLRYDYVEGTSTSPVGYLEGLYVRESSRKQGAAKQLIEACEDWAKSKGCREFASDCELANVDSLQMHGKLGFHEANRIVCFTKKL